MSRETWGDMLFGCWHRRKTMPISPRLGPDRRKRPAPFETYVVCLDCGKEFPYDWKAMRPLTTAEIRRFEATVDRQQRDPAAESVGEHAFASRGTHSQAA